MGVEMARFVGLTWVGKIYAPQWNIHLFFFSTLPNDTSMHQEPWGPLVASYRRADTRNRFSCAAYQSHRNEYYSLEVFEGVKRVNKF